MWLLILYTCIEVEFLWFIATSALSSLYVDAEALLAKFKCMPLGNMLEVILSKGGLLSVLQVARRLNPSHQSKAGKIEKHPFSSGKLIYINSVVDNSV